MDASSFLWTRIDVTAWLTYWLTGRQTAKATDGQNDWRAYGACSRETLTNQKMSMIGCTTCISYPPDFILFPVLILEEMKDVGGKKWRIQPKCKWRIQFVSVRLCIERNRSNEYGIKYKSMYERREIVRLLWTKLSVDFLLILRNFKISKLLLNCIFEICD